MAKVDCSPYTATWLEDIAILEMTHLPIPSEKKTISPGLTVTRHSVTVPSVYCKYALANNIMGDLYSLLVMFSSLSITEILRLKVSNASIHKLLQQHVHSDHGYLHCGQYIKSMPVGHASFVVPASKHRTGSKLYTNRTQGTTVQIMRVKNRAKQIQNVVTLPVSRACQQCNSADTFIITMGYSTCTNCGDCLPSLDDEPIQYMDLCRTSKIRRTHGTYSRRHTFSKCLDRAQGKEPRHIPQFVIDIVTKKQPLSVHAVCRILKQHRLQHYYPNRVKIYCLSTKTKPQTVLPLHEDILNMMFENYTSLWEKMRPTTRKSSLSYMFLLHQFCVLQGWTEYLDMFPLPKSVKVRRLQGEIWKNVCRFLDWQ